MGNISSMHMYFMEKFRISQSVAEAKTVLTCVEMTTLEHIFQMKLCNLCKVIEC